MKPILLKDTLKSLYAVKRTTCIEGPPGVGKTTLVREVAKELGVDYIERHMPTMLVEDFGIPYPNSTDESFSYKLPDWWPTDPESKGILCFDDRNQANADLQKVLANICQARNLHGVPLPAGWMVISTGNRQSDRAGSNKILSHLRNRETVIEFDVGLDDWTVWAINNGVNAELVGFIRFKPSALNAFDPNNEVNPTPRSWVEGVNNIIGVVPQAAEYDCFAGAVGAGAATEFNAYLKCYRDLPDPDEVIKDPDKYKAPTKPDQKYALSTALAFRADKKNITNVIKFLDKMDTEFAVLALTIAIKKDVNIGSSNAFIDWTTRNTDVFAW